MNRYNYVYSVLEPTNRLELRTRVDWNVSSATKAYVRLALDNEDIDYPRGVWGGNSELELATPVPARDLGRSLAVNAVQTLSPTMTNEALITTGGSPSTTRFATRQNSGRTRWALASTASRGSEPYVPSITSTVGRVQLGDY